MADTVTLPGFVDAHSHAFQRALRGRTEGGDFWTWREAMLDLARKQTPERVRTDYVAVYRELRAAGYTAVGEFHYLGFDEALAAADAAGDAGIAFVLLYAAYGRGGLERFRQPSVSAYLRDVERLRDRGLAVGRSPHSVRACPRDWLAEIGRYAREHELVLHTHADEQPREVEECLAEHGLRPIELLAETGCLGSRTLVEHGIALCIGSDSNVRIDPLEELRELEGIARRQALRRNVVAVDRLLHFGSHDGAASLGLASWDDVEIDADHASLQGVPPAELRAALVFGCSADVVR